MAPTPSSKSNQSHIVLKTPQSKHRINFNAAKPSPNPHSALKEAPPGEHPVEVVGRIRDHPDRKDSKAPSILQINHDTQTLRVRADFGYRDFSLDGISLSEEEDLDAFYKKFVESRINGVKLGDKCTIMMYGPTGSGKSHTMFGCSKQPGIVYRSLKDILGDGEDCGVGTFVHVTVLEIYNEEIYDLLSSNGGGGLGFGWPKGNSSKVRLEVMGKKAKNASYISGNEAGKISKEIHKVEKRRIVKSTLCNDRSSRSHCMIILDVPTVGGRLMLVDMAGSENIEQAGQIGLEAKMQTAKINQGNIALKRVVESIANGDSHVPFRDSKLTMLLQDSFEDDKSKILMILCASPDPKDIHKTISTLEYGAKAKCIIRGPHTPGKDNFGEDTLAAEALGSRITAMDQFIYKLQMENKVREKERNEAHKELVKKEQEVAALREKIQKIEGKGTEVSEEEINMKVNERTKLLRIELEKKLEECQRMAHEFVENERRRMEEKILQQQQEVEMLRQRLLEIESQFLSRDGKAYDSGKKDMDGSNFAKKLLGMYPDEDPGMVKSMDLDTGDQETYNREVRLIAGNSNSNCIQVAPGQPILNTPSDIPDCGVFGSKFGDRVCLSTVFEDEEVEETSGDEEVEKGIIEEKRICSSTPVDNSSPGANFSTSYFNPSPERFLMDREEQVNDKDAASSRLMRIQNIFTLCGNHRELSQHIRTKKVEKCESENVDPETSPTMTPNDETRSSAILLDSIKEESGKKVPDEAMVPKENFDPSSESNDAQIEVYVKWEASKENPGKFISTLKVLKEATLADLRKLIEIYLGADNQAFTFLVLGDPSGAPVSKEKEISMLASSLPVCNNQLHSHLACLRPGKGMQCPNHMPLSPLENKLPLTPNSHLTSPKVAKNLSPVPFVNPHSNIVA